MAVTTAARSRVFISYMILTIKNYQYTKFHAFMTIWTILVFALTALLNHINCSSILLTFTSEREETLETVEYPCMIAMCGSGMAVMKVCSVGYGVMELQLWGFGVWDVCVLELQSWRYAVFDMEFWNCSYEGIKRGMCGSHECGMFWRQTTCTLWVIMMSLVAMLFGVSMSFDYGVVLIWNVGLLWCDLWGHCGMMCGGAIWLWGHYDVICGLLCYDMWGL